MSASRRTVRSPCCRSGRGVRPSSGRWRRKPRRRALALDDRTFLAELQAAFGLRLGRFTRVGRRQAYPLALTQAERLTAPRAVILGNAAQSLHPVAGQGFNLALRDVALLAELLADAGEGDPGGPALLERYAAERAPDREAVVRFTDALVRGFGLAARAAASRARRRPPVVRPAAPGQARVRAAHHGSRRAPAAPRAWTAAPGPPGMKRDFDVVVVGGAMAGAGSAALLAATPATAGLRIALVEPRPRGLACGRCAARHPRVRAIARLATAARAHRRLGGRGPARRRLPAHGHLGRAPAGGWPGCARVRLRRARRARPRPHRREPHDPGRAHRARRGARRRAPRCRVRDARDDARRHPYRARRTGANSAPGWWSAPTGPSRRCAARPVSTRAAGTTVSAPSSPTSTARTAAWRDRLAALSRHRSACAAAARRRARVARLVDASGATPKRWCSAPTANSRSA